MKCHHGTYRTEPLIAPSNYFSAGFILGALTGLIGTAVIGLIALIVF